MAKRLVTDTDLAALPLSTRRAFIAAEITVDEGQRASERDVLAALHDTGFAAHPAALTFEKAYAGMCRANDDADVSFALGIFNCLRGAYRETFALWAPAIDDSDDETLEQSTPDVTRAKTYTPIGIVSGSDVALFMDEAGAVWCYSIVSYEFEKYGDDAAEFLVRLGSELRS